VPGDSADDPLYVPAIEAVQRSFGRGGKTCVGDCKMASLATRAFLAGTGDRHLCPLSEKQMSRAGRLARLEAVWSGTQSLQQVRAPADEDAPDEEPELVAEGFGFDVAVAAPAEEGGEARSWTERRWLVRSEAFARGQREGLRKRLEKAQQALARLDERKQGRKRLDAAGLREAAHEAIRSNRVEGLLSAQVLAGRTERQVRGCRGAPGRVEVREENEVRAVRDEEAIRRAEREMGWQVYATNREGTTLEEAVRAYRGQYRIEKCWSRLKGGPLALEPMHLKEEGRMEGLVLLLALALRALGLMQWQARESLANAEREEDRVLRGLYPGQAGRKTKTPSAEMLLGAFKGIRLVEAEAGGKTALRVTELGALRQRLLELWELPADLYRRLASHSAEPPRIMSER
jgi:transposase